MPYKKTINLFIPDAQCRLSRFGSFLPKEFYRQSCTYCYDLLKYVFPGFEALNISLNGTIVTSDDRHLDPTNLHDIQFIKESMDSLEFEKWRNCCSEAESCCNNVMIKESIETLNNTCKSIWDGWACHSATQAGQISKIKCPDHFIADTCNSVLGELRFEVFVYF